MTITFPESPLTIPQSQDLLITIETTTTADQNRKKKLTLIPLIFLIYFAASGGPHAEETAVHAAGPLFAILGFLIFPLIWSVPEALITAELSTAFPRNGGFVIWADRAFGPFWGSLMGTWRFFGGVFNIAVFPLLFIGYMEKLIPALESGWPRFIAASVSTLFLSFVNYTGVTVVGYAAVVLAIASLSPFILMCLIAVPKIHPHRWLSLGQEGVKKDWNLFFNILFWNLSVWDNASTLAGEVEKPKKNFPLALFSSVIFTYFAYMFPLLAVIGSVSADQRKWGYGFHADAAVIIGGTWLKYWIQVGAVLSAIGIFESQLSSIAYQLAGMADLGFLPEFFAVRSKRFNTPWVAILISTSIALAVSYMHLIDIILSANFLCSLGMLLEFASFIWLRRKFPALKRPFRVPMKLPGLVVMCLIPSGFLIFVMATATKTVYLISGVMTVGGIGWYFLINFCNKLFKFSSANHEFEQE